MIRLVAEADALGDAIGRVRRSGEGYSSNFFASPADRRKWIASGSLLLLQEQQAVLILRRDANFHRLYHIASDTAALSAALGVLCDCLPTTIVTDLIGRRENLQAVVNAHVENAFTPHKRLHRMQRLVEVSKQDWRFESTVEHAGSGDVARIHTFLTRQLDPLSEQVPDLAQLDETIVKRCVLVVKQASELAGVLIHDTTGLTTTLRYWHVDERFRSQGVGARLMSAFLSLCGASRRIVLWVIAGNDNAISIYRRYGFQDDCLVDDIMVRGLGSAR